MSICTPANGSLCRARPDQSGRDLLSVETMVSAAVLADLGPASGEGKPAGSVCLALFGDPQLDLVHGSRERLIGGVE